MLQIIKTIVSKSTYNSIFFAFFAILTKLLTKLFLPFSKLLSNFYFCFSIFLAFHRCLIAKHGARVMIYGKNMYGPKKN